jgi:hypothetical protein
MTRELSDPIFADAEFTLTTDDVADVRYHLGKFAAQNLTEEEILAEARYVYDFGAMLEDMAVPPEEIGSIVLDRVPDVDELYPLLRNGRSWGYVLGQQIKAWRFEQAEVRHAVASLEGIRSGESNGWRIITESDDGLILIEGPDGPAKTMCTFYPDGSLEILGPVPSDSDLMLTPQQVSRCLGETKPTQIVFERTPLTF